MEMSVPEAARALGISERAIRKRIERGTLPAHRNGTAWVVTLDGATVPPPPPAASGQTVTGGEPASLDLAPLAQLIDRLTAENARLTEAATVWQLRATQAEAQLKQLTAGTLEPAEVKEEAVPPPPVAGTASATAPVSLRPFWRRLLDRLGGTAGGTD